MRRRDRRIRRTRRGDFAVRLPAEERRILRSVQAQLRAFLSGSDPDLERLFPPAYPDDPDRQREYERLVRRDLLAERLRAVEVFERTVDARRLTEEEVLAWLGAINDARLVLGTKLDVTEESYDLDLPPDHPDAPAYALFFYLGWLEEQVVEALAGPPAP